MFLLGDGQQTHDWQPYSGRIYNNSLLTGSSKVKLVSWGFNRKNDNLTTVSPLVQIHSPSKVVQTSNDQTFQNLLWIFVIIFLFFLILIVVILFSLKFHRTKRKSLTPPPPECLPFDLTPKVLTMEMQMPILPPTISPASSGEPVEIRRTQPLSNYPPIPVEEFSTHLERLKAADNYKFSQEYEVRKEERPGGSLIGVVSSRSIRANSSRGRTRNSNVTKRRIATPMWSPTITRVSFFARSTRSPAVITSMAII